MIPTRRKPRKLLRTAFTALTTLFVAGYVASGSVAVGYTQSALGIGIYNGTCAVTVFGSSSLLQRLGWRALRLDHYELRCLQFPWYDWYWFSSGVFQIEIGLAPELLILIAICSLWYWRDWRKRRRPGFCPECGYDLRGCVDGRCSECGTTEDVCR